MIRVTFKGRIHSDKVGFDLNNMFIKTDLHTHSELSFDGKDTVDDLLEKASFVGLDAIAITDHDEIDASLEAEKKSSRYNIIAIPGMEVTSDVGHILAIGVREYIEKGLSFEKTVDKIRELGGIAIIPHPFQKTRHGVGAKISKERLSKVDGIEVYNSRLLTGWGNRRARRFAEINGIAMTGGSDAHIAEMVGSAGVTVQVEENTVDGIVKAIRGGETEVWGSRTPMGITISQGASGVNRVVKSKMKMGMKK